MLLLLLLLISQLNLLNRRHSSFAYLKSALVF
jgi:hypothetical protein